jgi:uncharacterized protein (DUF2267 family)
MPRSDVTFIERTVEKTYEWLNQLAEELGSPGDRHYAYRVLRAVFHALRDRLPVDAAAHLGAQLPELLRGVYYQNWRPAATPQLYHHVPEFLDRVAAEANLVGQTEADYAVAATARVLRRHITPGELNHVCAALPADIASLIGEAAAGSRVSR